MTQQTRYIDLLSRIPRGSFYEGIGNVLPYRNGNTTLRLLTNVPTTNFLILINNIQSGIAATDGSGEALFSIHLPLGDITLELQQEFSTNKLITYITTRDFSVWLAAYAEQFERIDDFSEATLNSYYLERAGSTDIDLAHGTRLLTPNEFGAELEAYREILQMMRQTFRQFAGRLSGKMAAVAAITQINPLIFDRSRNAPRWILGFQNLINGDFQSASRPFSSAGLVAQMNVVGNFVEIVNLDQYINTGTLTLNYNKNFKRFQITPPALSFFTPGQISTKYYESTKINGDGIYNIPTGRVGAVIDSLHPDGSSNFTFTANSRLYLNVDGRGDFAVVLNETFGGALPVGNIDFVVNTLNAYLKSANKYNSARVGTSLTAGAVDICEVVAISDDIAFTNPTTTSATGFIDIVGNTGRLSVGANVGSFITLQPDQLTRLVAAPGIWVDVFTNIVSNISSFTTISRRYASGVASKNTGLNKIRISSRNTTAINDGPSTITVLDGPFSQARTLFGLDQKVANITATALVNATQVRVPAGTMAAFNSVNGISNLPFDVIVGRGPGPTLLQANRSVATADNGLTAVVTGVSGVTLVPGFTHVNWAASSVASGSSNYGIHPISNLVVSGTSFNLRYKGFGVQRIANTGVHPVSVDPSLAPGTLNVRYTSPNLLAFKQSADGAFGPDTTLTGDGYYRLFNTNVWTTAKWLDVLVESAALPGITGTVNISVASFSAVSPGSGGNMQFWSSGEKATVTAVTAIGFSDEIWTLAAPLAGTYNTSFGPYEVLPFARHMPTTISGHDTFGSINLNLDVSEAPIAAAVAAASITVQEPDLPDGWIDRSSPATSFVITPEAKFATGALLINNNTTAVVFERKIKITDDMLGYKFIFKTWLRNVEANGNNNIQFNLEFDFGSGPIVSSSVLVNSGSTTQYPQLLEFSQILPVSATEFAVRIRRTTGGTGAGKAIVEQAVLIKQPFGSLFLGDGTIPRSGGRTNFGELFYVWSPVPLVTTVRNVLGIGAPTPEGLIRSSHNAHEQIDSFDVSDVVGGSVVNVRGTINDTDWSVATLTNLEVVSRSPSQYSYVRPLTSSEVVGEQTIFAQTPPNTTTLAFSSDQNQSNTIVYEEGVPLPNDQWQFNSASEIEIVSGFVPGADYTVDYHKLTQVETAPIDLQSPLNNGADTWFADYVVWNRHASDISMLQESTSLIFDTAFSATLPRRSDQNKIQSSLVEETGTSRRVIPQSAWRYTDSLTVNIDGNQFNPNAIYSFTYNQRFTDPRRIVGIISEIRSAASVFSLGSETYVPFTVNQIVDGALRFHQIRLTLTDIQDIRDIRVHSAILKGLNLYDAGSPPPGL